jgi:hypothetical protein
MVFAKMKGPTTQSYRNPHMFTFGGHILENVMLLFCFLDLIFMINVIIDVLVFKKYFFFFLLFSDNV